jgi:hypothetical protein
MSAFPLRIPIHGVALFESDFMIALGKRQGDIARPLRLDIVEVFAVVIDLSVAVESKALNAVCIRDVALHLTQYRCFTPYEPPIR